jgi:hypothetical protein
VLSDSGFGKNDAFYRVAQAISEDASNEKQGEEAAGWIPGWQRANKRGFNKEAEKDSEQQGRLF